MKLIIKASPFQREPHEPQAICLSLRWYHFRWFGACRSAAAESAKPCRIHLCDGDPPIVMKCGRPLYPSRGRTTRLAVYGNTHLLAIAAVRRRTIDKVGRRHHQAVLMLVGLVRPGADALF